MNYIFAFIFYIRNRIWFQYMWDHQRSIHSKWFFQISRAHSNSQSLHIHIVPINKTVLLSCVLCSLLQTGSVLLHRIGICNLLSGSFFVVYYLMRACESWLLLFIFVLYMNVIFFFCIVYIASALSAHFVLIVLYLVDFNRFSFHVDTYFDKMRTYTELLNTPLHVPVHTAHMRYVARKRIVR